MIISRAPIRISFLGGGTDYPEYFSRHPGAVLGTAINKYSYINVQKTHPFFDYNYRISYSKSELVKSVDEIKHPSVKACLKFKEIKEHVEIHYQGDWPARTGLGSSSSFTVSLLTALYAFKNQLKSREKLAREAIYVEREVIRERVGWQDQIWASYGGMGKIEFFENNFSYRPLTISADRKKDFRRYFLLFFTGIKRFSHDVLEEQITKTKRYYNDGCLEEMYQLVQEGEKILYSGDLTDFGKIFHENWKIKKSLSSKVSNSDIDRAYEIARDNGAIGAKILGAGGGGFLLLFAEPQNHKRISTALKNMVPVDFDFEENGSHIIYYEK